MTNKGDNMHTLSSVMDASPITRPDHLPADLQIPVLTGLQAQGDVLVSPATSDSAVFGEEWWPVPTTGLVVVRGEVGGNTHLLVCEEGEAEYTSVTDESGLALFGIRVKSVGWLLHPEHGANGIGKGLFVLRRQREMTAAGWRRVTD